MEVHSTAGMKSLYFAIICLCMLQTIRSQVMCDLTNETLGRVCEPSGDCYMRTPPFDGFRWPLPDCHVPVFRLYRKDIGNGGEWKEINRTYVPEEYNRLEETVFLVHGYQGSGDSFWVQDAKDEFLTGLFGGTNVVVVDWQDGANTIDYTQAASNVRVTGSEIADINNVLDPRYSWCVGHSLGAHSCGHAGKRVGFRESKFDRITGLDPAGPNFDEDGCADEDMSAECRLHPNDADQVDVIHTDGKDGVDSYGTMHRLGHIDFYPNGAQLQPSCPDFIVDAGCNHGMACDYFIESIRDDCYVVRDVCWDQYNLPYSCRGCYENECTNMGAPATTPQEGTGIFYLETNENKPYCQG